MGLSSVRLLRISMIVAGLIRIAKGQARVEIPYARGTDMWKLEKSGKFPGASKEAVVDIVKKHGGKHPKYEEDGLVFDVPADKAESALEDIKNLSGIDKAFGKLFDSKKGMHWERDKGAKDKPVTVDKKVDPKLEKKSEKWERDQEKKLEKKEKAKKPENDKPDEKPERLLPDDPADDWNELGDAFGVPPRGRLRKTPEDDRPARPSKKLIKDEKPAGKAEPKPEKQEAPKAGAPKGSPSGDSQKPESSGRRRPGPPPKPKFMKSLDRMSQVVQNSEDQSEIVEAVEDFLDGIRYDSWPETG
jgi:hypothetical protein